MQIEILRDTPVRSRVRRSWAVAVMRPEGRRALSGTYEVVSAGKVAKTAVSFLQETDKETQAAILAFLKPRCKGKVRIVAR